MKSRLNSRRLLCLLGLLGIACRSAGGVVINEVFYHAPDELDDLQWIELHNPDAQAADLSGWKLRGGVDFQFPPGTTLAPGGFLVVCRDAKLFGEFHDAAVAGQFRKSLGRGGDTVEIADAGGRLVDRVTYDDRDPWPAAADGASASLERITPGHPGDRVENWTASPLPDDASRPAGTPGQTNAAHTPHFPPVIRGLAVTPKTPTPGQPLLVQVEVEDPEGIQAVELRYRIVLPGKVGGEQVLPMKAGGGRTWSGEIPGQESGSLVRLRVRAVNRRQAERYQPSPSALEPAVSLFVQARPEGGGLPQAQVIHADAAEFATMERVRRRALQKDEGPFGNQASRRLQDLLQRQLNLRDAWFEWSIHKDLDAAGYRALRAVVASRSADRNALLEEAMATDTPEAFEAAAATRIQGFQKSLISGVQSALPGDLGAAFEPWYRARIAVEDPGPGGFLESLFSPEAGWLALNVRFELTESQRAALRTALQAAVRGRADQAATLQKVMSGAGEFGTLLEQLGTLESAWNAACRQHLTARQRRFLLDWKGAQGSFIRPRVTEAQPRPPRGNTAVVVTDPATGAVEVFDFIHVNERSAGFKVRFHKDRPFRGMTAANIIFEYNDRFAMAEPLAFELYRRAGNAACETDFVRLTLNGHPMGYHLLFEQVNGAFLRQHRIAPDGDLYKILWYGLGVEGQHEKQDHPDRDHRDLTRLLTALEAASGDAQWAVIEKHFNVDQVATYFAVNMVLSHWDGFFNNYFTYHDRKGSGKWEIYPWDQDKTWGFHDASGETVFFDMPLTFGMAGDRPPGGGPPVFNPGHWWRPGGFFSRPLLANPEFRKRYLRRTRELLDTVYTEAVFFPVIETMAARLRPEVPLRAKLRGENPDEALARLDRNVASLKEHLVKRRAFLLAQDELAQVGQ
ncbi:MAG: CotH kinase family protein [Verrucomicrobia bacterium]|nr:CotH kinase family protein [Verrucomicrobiota bacterium]